MVALDKSGLAGVAPGIGIKVQTEHEVGLEGIIDELGSRPDLGSPVKEPLGESLQGGRGVGGFAGIRGEL